MISPADIFAISSRKQFVKTTLKVFRHQYANNSIYSTFCDHLRRTPDEVSSVEQIPFLPISFFKSHPIITGDALPEITFTSSGTTGERTSSHLVADLDVYRESFSIAFRMFYGPVEDYVILALLPSYLERTGSSLVYMVDELIKASGNPESGFYLDNYDELIHKLERLDADGRNVLLIGVTYALLDVVQRHRFKLRNTIIMETGGMKGKRKELIREELHAVLCEGFGVSSIHSEYGMTELLSQAYSHGSGIFQCPPWMQILTRDPEDALTLQGVGKTGGLNIIDLANIHSCSFIATQDLGKVYEDGSFEVLGRFDHSDIRGCNLMVVS